MPLTRYACEKKHVTMSSREQEEIECIICQRPSLRIADYEVIDRPQTPDTNEEDYRPSFIYYHGGLYEKKQILKRLKKRKIEKGKLETRIKEDEYILNHWEELTKPQERKKRG